jgi:hypothetical protein
MRRARTAARQADDAPSRALGARERRAHERAQEACRAVLCDGRGRPLGRGKTSNISEGGVHVLVPGPCPAVRVGRRVRIELTVPDTRAGGRRRCVRYTAIVLRNEPVGQWTGIAVRFESKLA